MKVQVLGCGVVGMATADGFRRFGHDIVLVDIDEAKVAKLKEEGWNASTEPEEAGIHFICVPEKSVGDVVKDLCSGGFNKWIGLIVIKSSVEPGTCKKLTNRYGRHISSNPEFLKAATALWDFLNPDKIVIGECCREHGDLLESLYKPFRAPIVRVDPTTAEMVKMATNAYLASQISFWNSIHEICEKTGINSHTVGNICAMDRRISRCGASQHGQAYGGYCLPKDLDHLINYSESVGYDPIFLKAVKEVNDECVS